MFGYYQAGPDPQPNDPWLPQSLSATESDATIHGGTNNVPLDFTDTDINIAVDNTIIANVCSTDVSPIPTNLINGPDSATTDPIQTSYEPAFLSYDQLDLVAPRQMSHKVFANLSLVCDRGNWQPFLGAGGFIEVGRNKDCNRYPNCPYNMISRIDCALSQWAVWFKVGVAFE